MVDAGKKRDPWTFFLHDSASDETTSVSRNHVLQQTPAADPEPSVRKRRCIAALHGGILQQPDARQNLAPQTPAAPSTARDRPVRPASSVGMKNALIPAPRTNRIFRIIANHIQQSPRGADAHRLRYTAASAARGCAAPAGFRPQTRQNVSAAVRFSAPLAAHPCRSPPETSGRLHCSASFPTRLFSLVLRVALISNACRNCTARLRNRSRAWPSRCTPTQRLRPQRMIEHHQHFRKRIEHGQQFQQAPLVRLLRIRGQLVHDRLRLPARQIMYAQMKNGSCERNAPLQRDRRLPGFSLRAQHQRRFNVVVIRQRDQALQSRAYSRSDSFPSRTPASGVSGGVQYAREKSTGILDFPALLFQSLMQHRALAGQLRNAAVDFLSNGWCDRVAKPRPVYPGQGPVYARSKRVLFRPFAIVWRNGNANSSLGRLT